MSLEAHLRRGRGEGSDERTTFQAAVSGADDCRAEARRAGARRGTARRRARPLPGAVARACARRSGACTWRLRAVREFTAGAFARARDPGGRAILDRAI